MALVGRDRRYVAINNAAVELYQYGRDEVIGEIAGRTARDVEPATRDAQWEELITSNELYGERVVEHGSGAPMRVSYAAHTTKVNGRWLALFVTLSAQLEPTGEKLIAADLYLSPATVRSHVRNAMVKTGAHTRAQLVAIALGDGLVAE